ncbi:unnamed protein product [Vitrella brassicaformis CCMP3155]|uniref:Uncharacterized protein n=1 Tax=Vitrella brassicaformis (strain CCMP3155) TaxID=1169540 RepID=A0A0G4EJP6_VITBC|nr:unnamed protein product [Vitrella brassicaformis CCMP3155]|eukprot:CEL96611.1 unnamed protein product [Vitrella brassicaformis CCMP3155]
MQQKESSAAHASTKGSTALKGILKSAATKPAIQREKKKTVRFDEEVRFDDNGTGRLSGQQGGRRHPNLHMYFRKPDAPCPPPDPRLEQFCPDTAEKAEGSRGNRPSSAREDRPKEASNGPNVTTADLPYFCHALVLPTVPAQPALPAKQPYVYLTALPFSAVITWDALTAPPTMSLPALVTCPSTCPAKATADKHEKTPSPSASSGCRTGKPTGIMRAGEEEDREEFVRLDNCGNPVKLTTAEKERVFLDALQSYYLSGWQALTDGDFDLLKQDLAWEGSDVIFLTRNETLFLNAMSAYMKGQPIVTDEEFDTLKAELRNQGSRIAVTSDPKCAVDTGVCRVTWKKDRIRNYMVYLPWMFLSTVLWSFLAFEFIPVLRSVNPFLNLFISSPIIWTLAMDGTENLFLKE